MENSENADEPGNKCQISSKRDIKSIIKSIDTSFAGENISMDVIDDNQNNNEASKKRLIGSRIEIKSIIKSIDTSLAKKNRNNNVSKNKISELMFFLVETI